MESNLTWSSLNQHTVYLALGSNMGDRRANLSNALKRLEKILTIEKISSVYETEPVGYLDQPRFLNIVCQATTEQTVRELLKQAKAIEVAIGRQPTFRNGPRPIDIDILLYDNLQLQEEGLTVPHPRMKERAFVLAPLAEIAPEVVEPASGRTARELLASVSQEGITRLDSLYL